MQNPSRTMIALCIATTLLTACTDTALPVQDPEHVAFAAPPSKPISTKASTVDDQPEATETDGNTPGENVAAAVLVVGLVAICPACVLALAF